MSEWIQSAKEYFYRFAASGWVPPSVYLRDAPRSEDLSAKTGRLQLEIVSHCWQYSHLQNYQLSSLLLFPPRDCDVTMTVFFCPEDTRTATLLEFFRQQTTSSVRWNWWPLRKEELFRRGIGRNLAAKATDADWIWFTDCDQLFRGGCIDTLNRELQGRRDVLVYPRNVSCTQLLEDNDDVLMTSHHPSVIDIDISKFRKQSHSRAIGALQILHGDVARQTGYCDSVSFFQQPVSRWNKCYEDRALRWILRTQGVPIDVPEIYRIEHVRKGRYANGSGQPGLVRRIAARVSPRRIHRI